MALEMGKYRSEDQVVKKSDAESAPPLHEKLLCTLNYRLLKVNDGASLSLFSLVEQIWG
jgi:hypothetical protein